MSKPNDHSAQAIPTGILVSVSGDPTEPERPAPKRKSAPRERNGQFPWLWAITAASISWAIAIFTIGVCTTSNDVPEGHEPSAINDGVTVRAIARMTPTVKLAPAPSKPAPNPVPQVHDESPTEIALRDTAEPPIPAPAPATPPPMPPVAVVAAEPTPVANATANVEEPKNAKPVRPVRPDTDLGVFANCDQIGSSILFMRSPPDAFQKAREEKKLVFMVHLSGNLEDPGFT